MRGQGLAARRHWDDRLPKHCAENLFLDQTKERRRAEIERLRGTVGACAPGSGFDTVENALRGSWTLSCERGKLEVRLRWRRRCRRSAVLRSGPHRIHGADRYVPVAVPRD
jgi:hypothetical protein